MRCAPVRHIGSSPAAAMHRRHDGTGRNDEVEASGTRVLDVLGRHAISGHDQCPPGAFVGIMHDPHAALLQIHMNAVTK